MFGEVLGGALWVFGAAIVGTEVLVEGSVLEHVIDDAQHRCGDGDDRLLVTQAGLEAEVSRPETGLFHLRRRQRRLDEDGLQPWRAFAETPRSLSTRALVVEARNMPAQDAR